MREGYALIHFPLARWLLAGLVAAFLLACAVGGCYLATLPGAWR